MPKIVCLRIFVNISLVLLLLSKLFYGLVLQVHFYMNQAEITRLECENKNRPEMHCNGKCYLAKQLQKVEEELKSRNQQKDKSLSLMKVVETDCMSTVKTPIIHLASSDLTLTQKGNFSYQFSIQTSLQKATFHPPCC